MKITLAPSEAQERKDHYLTVFGTVTIEVPWDDLTIDEVWSNLIRPALIGWGYGGSTVDKIRKES